MEIYLTSFGNSMFKNSIKRIEEEAKVFNLFKKIYCWTEHNVGYEYYQKHNDFINNTNRGFGYYLWKPHIIEKTLNLIPNDTFLFYVDAGCTFNLEGKKRLIEYVELLSNSSKDILSFQLEFPEKQWSKMDLCVRLNFISEEQLNSKQCLTGIILFKNNSFTKKFVNNWKLIMEESYHYIDDTPSLIPNDPIFVENRFDQSVYSILLKQNIENALILPDETYWHPNWDLYKHYPIHAKRIRN